MCVLLRYEMSGGENYIRIPDWCKIRLKNMRVLVLGVESLVFVLEYKDFQALHGGATSTLSKSLVFIWKYNDFQALHRGGGGTLEQIISFHIEI